MRKKFCCHEARHSRVKCDPCIVFPGEVVGSVSSIATNSSMLAVNIPGHPNSSNNKGVDTQVEIHRKDMNPRQFDTMMSQLLPVLEGC